MTDQKIRESDVLKRLSTTNESKREEKVRENLKSLNKQRQRRKFSLVFLVTTITPLTTITLLEKILRRTYRGNQ